MATFFWLWCCGLLVGIVAGCALLARRGALSPASAATFPWAVLGLAIGAKVQYRLEFLPLLSAIRFDPRTIFEPGERAPVGVLIGALAAAAWVQYRRLPRRDVGDALALATMLGLALGRVGCIFHGCCLGTVCPRWAACLCVHADPGVAGMIPGMFSPSGVSQPVIPLSSLFLLTGLCVVAIMLDQLRRGAPPGRLLAIAAVLGPLTKAALEPLRAEPRPATLMIGLPLVAAVMSTLAVAWSYYARVERPNG